MLTYDTWKIWKKTLVFLVSFFTPPNNGFSCKAHQPSPWKTLIKRARLVLLWIPHKPFDIKKHKVKKNEAFEWKPKKLLELLMKKVNKTSCDINEFHLFMFTWKKGVPHNRKDQMNRESKPMYYNQTRQILIFKQL
jgi:hypothetical protein